jgi:hypothetical protein
MDDDNGGDGDDDGGSNNGGSTSKQTAELAAKSTPKNQSTKSCQLQGNHSKKTRKKVTLVPEGGHALSGDGIGSMATVAARTQDRTLLCVLKTVATAMTQATGTALG